MPEETRTPLLSVTLSKDGVWSVNERGRLSHDYDNSDPDNVETP